MILTDLNLTEKSINDLLSMKKKMVRLGYSSIAAEIEQELNNRGYFEVLPVENLCTCREIAGDDLECVVHHSESRKR